MADSASLWNFTTAPGWKPEESITLKLALCKYGIGKWVEIQASGVLPGKVIQQLNGQTQRLLGQQSIGGAQVVVPPVLAALTGLSLDIDKIRADNNAKTDALRKNNLVINTGRKCTGRLQGRQRRVSQSRLASAANPTKEIREALRREYQEKYGLSQDDIDAIDLPRPVSATNKLDVKDLSRTEMIELLSYMHEKLKTYTKRLEEVAARDKDAGAGEPEEPNGEATTEKDEAPSKREDTPMEAAPPAEVEVTIAPTQDGLGPTPSSGRVSPCRSGRIPGATAWQQTRGKER
eukprot:scaffold4990_cov387-Prasinococcus_capsulatus_cf.AAC.6